jgi:[protein-PII] uridylyltransferase
MILATQPAFEPLQALATLPEPSGDLEATQALARDFLGHVRAELRARHDAGAGGLALVAAYTDAMDRFIALLFANAQLRYQARNPFINQRCAVVALGGYGRGELNPSSDIDLLVLYPWKVNPYVETVTEAILYPLWDAGLHVGHAMRNPRECARLAAQDLKVKTAVLDARFVSGDEGLYAEFDARMLDEVWAPNPTKFWKEKLAENTERHARAGHSVYLLQPDLKEGQGGLRDLHTAMWMAKIKYKVRRMRDLVALGVMNEQDIADLDGALDFLWRVRNAMHLLTGAHTDRLTFELQEQLAPALGFGEGRAGTERFMRTYYGNAATLHRLGEMIIQRSTQVAEPYRRTPLPVRVIRDGMRIQGNLLSVTGREVFERDPAAVLGVFVEAQRHGATLAPATRDLVRGALPLLAAVRDDPAVGQKFVGILRARSQVADTLFEMHRLGVLKTLLPEFGHLECLIAHDPFHVYTVDHHSLMGVREIERLRAGEFAESLPHLTQVVRELHQPELLMLGMIFHDVGKGHGKDHSGRGAAMMRDIAVRLGLNEDETASAVFLVQHHLLMSHLAQRRDVNDDQLVIDFSRTVGSVQNLHRLFVLTYADMRAVGPGVWNNWRGTLVTELYCRARDFFERDVLAAGDRAERAERVRRRVVEAAEPARQAQVAAFVASMPDGYLLSAPEDAIPEHADLRRRFEEAEAAGDRPAVTTALTAYPDRGITAFAVCTRDRPGLFAMLSGVLAAHGLNILAARIDTSSDGVALDVFDVSHDGTDLRIDHDRWERVDRTLRGVLGGEIDVQELVRRSHRSPLLAKRRRPVPTRVEIDNQVSADRTVLDVYAADRVGLLFTITNTLYHLWLEIHLAKITTMANQVLDVFYVTDHEGRKIEDPERLEAIRTELVRALTSDGSETGASPPAPAPPSGARVA